MMDHKGYLLIVLIAANWLASATDDDVEPEYL